MLSEESVNFPAYKMPLFQTEKIFLINNSKSFSMYINEEINSITRTRNGKNCDKISHTCARFNFPAQLIQIIMKIAPENTYKIVRKLSI
jgi:hypothetical protein